MAVESRGPQIVSLREDKGGSLSKYTNCTLSLSLERKSYLFKKSLTFHTYGGLIFPHQTNFWCQNSQKVLLCRHFGGCCPLASSVKADQTKFCSPPIKLLESFVCSIDGHNMKCP
jgi:hypothetical protein